MVEAEVRAPLEQTEERHQPAWRVVLLFFSSLFLSTFLSLFFLSNTSYTLTHCWPCSALLSYYYYYSSRPFFFCSLNKLPTSFFERSKKRKKSCVKQTPERASRSRKTRARTTSTKSRHLFCFAPLPTQPARGEKVRATTDIVFRVCRHVCVTRKLVWASTT